ncbi:MAG: S8 family serine peptidase [Oscillochloris sp.]|nr:S8 family serine peptidase [Oscillochloris sp.]
MSYPYGQPEDALTLMADLASYYGSLVVAAAGNDGDVPYIVGTPASASASLAVAESTVPAAPALTALASDRTLDTRLQAWSAPLYRSVGGELRIGDGKGDNLDGCRALPRWDGTQLLLLGGCPAAVKARNAAAAGADLVLIGDISMRREPPALYGAYSPIPVLSLANHDLQVLLAADAPLTVTVDPAGSPEEQVAVSASRGPRLNDSALKPDLAAPGAILSAQAGSGTALAPFGGSSGSAPVVAGTAALIVRELERRGLISADPGLRENLPESLTLAPLIKGLLMNTSAATLTLPDGRPAPPTLIGSGRVDAYAAVRVRTIALDTTELNALFAATPALAGCTVTPYRDLINYVFFGRLPPCAQEYPFGNDLLRAWNAQTGSVSFGYQPVSRTLTLERQVAVLNVSQAARSYRVRADQPADPGVQVSVTPAEFSLSGAGLEVVTLTLQLDAAALTARSEVANGLYEVAGELLIDGGSHNLVRLPWHVLPHRIADLDLVRQTESQAILVNTAPAQPAAVDAFALVDLSPNQCDTAETCSDVDYIPGIYPGLRYSPPDLAAIGVRGRSLPGLNASFGLPPAPAGAVPDELVEFAVTLHDLPYRAAPYVPVGLEVTIDANRDGSDDFRLTTVDSGDGRVGLQVLDLNPADGDSGTRDVGYGRAEFQANSWILGVPAAAVGLRSDQAFAFKLVARDHYFSAEHTTVRRVAQPAVRATTNSRPVRRRLWPIRRSLRFRRRIASI